MKEWAVFMVGCGWLAARSLWNLRPIRSGQDKWLALLAFGLLIHFFLLFVFPIIRVPDKLFQVPWPWMAMFHAMLALAWLSDIRRCIRREDLLFLVKLLSGVGVVLAVHMALQRFDLDPVIWLIRKNFKDFKWLHENHMIGLMGSPFQASAALAVLIPAVSYLAFQAGNRIWKLTLCLALAVCWMSGSATSFLAALIGAVVASRKVQTLKLWILLAVLGLAAIAVIHALRPDFFFDHGRLSIWKQAIHHMINHPFLGVGLNQFKLLKITYIPNNVYDVRWAHSEWVHFATELGVVWTAFLALYLSREAIKLYRVHSALFGCFVSTLVLSLFHIPWHLAPVLAVTGICLSASHIEPRKGV